jgi:hypothetical protein
MIAPVGGIDIGVDRRSPVSWRLYEQHGCFPFSGEMISVTIEPHEWAPDMGPDRVGQIRRRLEDMN